MKKDNDNLDKKNNKWWDYYIIFVLIFTLFLILFVIFPEITFNKISRIANKFQIVSINFKKNKNELDKKIIDNVIKNSDKYTENNKGSDKYDGFSENNIKVDKNEHILKEINKIVFDKDDLIEYSLEETILLNYVDDVNVEDFKDNNFIIKDNADIYQTALFIDSYDLLEDNNEIYFKIEYFYKNINLPENIIHTTDKFSLKIGDYVIKPSESIELSIVKDFQSDIIQLCFKIDKNISYEELFLNDIQLIYEDDYNYRLINLKL